MVQMTQKTIDIDHILRSKMGDKAKWVPSPLINWLKRIAHQDEVNQFLWESRDKTGTDWLEECVRYLRMTLVIKGRENYTPLFPITLLVEKTVLLWGPSLDVTTTHASAIWSMTCS